MKACWCTLPSLHGSDVCKGCANFEENTNLTGDAWYPNQIPTTVPYTYQPKTVNVKRTTKTIEKWGPDGEYLGKEVITEEVEDDTKQVYDGTIYIGGSPGTTVQFDPNAPNTLTNPGYTSGTVTYKGDVPSTYTSTYVATITAKN